MVERFIDLQFDAEAGKIPEWKMTMVISDPGVDGVCRAHFCELPVSETHEIAGFGDVGLCEEHSWDFAQAAMCFPKP